MTDTTTDASASVPARTPAWLVAAIAAVLGLLYAYAVWNAVGNLVLANQAAAELGLALTGPGWLLYLLAVLVPIAVWAFALWLGRRRAAHELFLIMLTGLALVAVFWLDVVSFSVRNTGSLVG